MKSYSGLAVVALAGMFLAAVGASEARASVCLSDYYTGHGFAKKWQTGRARARNDWHNRVDDAVGYPWSYWAKARVKDESCKWGGATNHCHVKAYPCK